MQIKPQPARASKQSVALNYTLQSMFDKSSMATACFGFKDRTGGYEESSGTIWERLGASERIWNPLEPLNLEASGSLRGPLGDSESLWELEKCGQQKQAAGTQY